MRLRSARSSWLLLVGLAACASAPTKPEARVLVDRTRLWPELASPDAQGDRHAAFPARRLDEGQLEEVKRAAKAWQEQDDETWRGLRDELGRDPLTSLWLTRMLIVDLLRRQPQGVDQSDDEADRVVKDVELVELIAEESWQRPMDELVAMGSMAAPCVTLDLLCSSQADRRLLGKRLLQEMGPENLSSWSRVLGVDEVRVRRAAIETVAEWGLLPETGELLQQSIHDPDFGIRAAAWRGFAGDTPQLAKGLAEEQDPFVRRAIYATLAVEPDRAAATLLVQQLQVELRDGRPEMVYALQRALQEISGSQRDLSLAEWQNWLAAYQPNPN